MNNDQQGSQPPEEINAETEKVKEELRQAGNSFEGDTPEEKEELTPAPVVVPEEKKEEEKKERMEIFNSPEMPLDTYDIIYCDPPWKYDFAETNNRKIENHYPTMSIDELCEMEIPKIQDNALLLMWATSPKLVEALKLIDAWGFNYKTHSIWNKEIIGMGYWFRGQHELLLVATKGNFSPPEIENRNSSIYSEKRNKHSKKPEFYYDWIDKSWPYYNKIEMFARQKKEGWSYYGNE